MICEEAFRKVEGVLYQYYWNLRQTEKIKYRAIILSKHKEDIERDIRETNINIEVENKTIDYRQERINKSICYTGYAEAAAIKEIEKLEYEWKITHQRILKINARIRELEGQMAEIEFIIGQLDEEEKRFIELKYGEEKSLQQIGESLNMSKTTASRHRKEIVELVSKWLNVAA